MTTISNNRRRGFFSRYGLVIVLVLVVFFLIALWRTPLASVFWRVASPVFVGRNIAFGVVGELFSQFSSKAQLIAENDALKMELASTTATLMDRELLYKENVALKIRFDRTLTGQTILAAVIMRPPGVPYDTLMLDAGHSQGVTQGDLVSAGGSVVIGRITDVYQTTSRATLLSTPGESYNALLRGSVPVTVIGQGSGSMYTQVPAGTAVAVGDPIIFPGIMLGFSADVASIVQKDGDSFQTLYLHLPVDPLELQYVDIQKPEAQ
jgi:cell shape-determining protein MreC